MGSITASETSDNVIRELRQCSRQLVREWGYMNPTAAGTAYNISVVHALIEISLYADSINKPTASELCGPLNLDKSSVSRIVKKLVEAGEVIEEFDGGAAGKGDGRVKRLVLSDKGKETIRGVDEFGNYQVSTALSKLSTITTPANIITSIRAYAEALRSHRLSLSSPTPKPSTSPSQPEITIEPGYRPGVISSTIGLQIAYYGPNNGFGMAFESILAEGMSDLVTRLDGVKNQVWCAMYQGKIVGCVWIDGEMGLKAPTNSNSSVTSELLDLDPKPTEDKVGVKEKRVRGSGKKAHLRYFIVDSGMHGKGIGKRLMGKAVEFCDEKGFEECRLSTFKGLEAARKLYDRAGFVLDSEFVATPWGVEVLVQWMVRKRGGGV